VISRAGREDLALVYLAETGPGRYVEFVESVQPPLPRSEKWVLIVSTLLGCPVGCAMCDAGGHYGGALSADEILAQIDWLVDRRFPGRAVTAGKFKIQFARVGEPSLNPAVLDVLETLPDRYAAPGLLPSVSSVAPAGSERFFDRLLGLKREIYGSGRFQLQFSIHSTDPAIRDRLIPARKWDLAAIASYGEAFFAPGDRKITLNSALPEGAPLDAGALARHFDPAKFLVKITPVNPTYQARRNGLATHIVPGRDAGSCRIVEDLRLAGFEVLVSVGEPEENLIGSNCGQYVRRHLREGRSLAAGYSYSLESGLGIE